MEFKRILLIIDDINVKMQLEKLLTEYSVHSVSNIADGLDLFKTHIYPIVITDINFSSQEGNELINKIKRINKDTAIIAVADEAKMKSSVEALKIGNLNFFTKPIDSEEILNSVKEIFKMKEILDKTRDIDYYLKSMSKRYEIPNDLNLISDLASTLSRDLIISEMCDENEIINIDLALVEMLTNAIEHGNMEIDEEEKTELIQNKSFNYSEELDKRSKEKPYCDRKVIVEAFIDHGKVKYIISDQGQGFEYENIEEKIKNKDLLRITGRGIIMSYAIMDEVIYEGSGNKVTLIKYFNK